MKRRSPPAPCCASSTIQRPGCSRRSSATPTASTSPPNSSSDPRPSRARPSRPGTSPGSPTNPPGRPCGPTCSPSRPKQENIHSATCRQPPPVETFSTAGDMAAVLYWRLPELPPTNPGPLPWLPGIPATLHAHPVWGPYLAKRSQLVADLADQVQDHACQGDAPPVWAPREAIRAPPSSATLQCGRPPTASILKTRDQPEEPNSRHPAPCGNNASTGISRVPLTRQQMRGPTSHRQDAPHSVQGMTGNARTTHSVNGRARRPHPADSTLQSSGRGARKMRLHSTRWQDRQHHAAESGSFRS